MGGNGWGRFPKAPAPCDCVTFIGFHADPVPAIAHHTLYSANRRQQAEIGGNRRQIISENSCQSPKHCHLLPHLNLRRIGKINRSKHRELLEWFGQPLAITPFAARIIAKNREIFTRIVFWNIPAPSRDGFLFCQHCALLSRFENLIAILHHETYDIG